MATKRAPITISALLIASVSLSKMMSSFIFSSLLEIHDELFSEFCTIESVLEKLSEVLRIIVTDEIIRIS